MGWHLGSAWVALGTTPPVCTQLAALHAARSQGQRHCVRRVGALCAAHSQRDGGQRHGMRFAASGTACGSHPARSQALRSCVGSDRFSAVLSPRHAILVLHASVLPGGRLGRGEQLGGSGTAGGSQRGPNSIRLAARPGERAQQELSRCCVAEGGGAALGLGSAWVANW